MPEEALRVPGDRDSQISRQSAHEGGKAVNPTTQEIFLVLISERLSQPQGHSAAGRSVTMKNSIDTIGNRTRDLPPCSAVAQPTAPPRTPNI